jgi:putative phage-type endonuclease
MSYQQENREEWLKQRLGLVTGSAISNVLMDSSKAGHRNYMAQLVCERLTGEPTETYISPAMQHGIDTEDEARAAYMARNAVIVEEVGFIRHPKLEAGCSPDGIVGQDGLIEIKCVQPATALDLLESKKVPADHYNQIQWQLAVTGRDWCDYVVYQPKLPERLRLNVMRVVRNQSDILNMTVKVEQFLEELNRKVKKLKEMTL